MLRAGLRPLQMPCHCLDCLNLPSLMSCNNFVEPGTGTNPTPLPAGHQFVEPGSDAAEQHMQRVWLTFCDQLDLLIALKELPRAVQGSQGGSIPMPAAAAAPKRARKRSKRSGEE